MIYLCVVWRKGKWVITSSDTVTFKEKFQDGHKVWQEGMEKIYSKESPLLKYFMRKQAERRE